MSVVEPLIYEFLVACAPDHAFATWTARMDAWWPKDHSKSGDPGLQVEVEPDVGGSIRERTSSGEVLDWGRITRWDPPNGLAYTWFVGSNEADATVVEVTFTEADGKTLVRLVHRGWERFGETAGERRSRNRAGWADVLPRYLQALDD